MSATSHMVAVVATAAACMPATCWGRYRRIAVLLVPRGLPEGWYPSMASARARGVVAELETWERLSVGSTERCAYERALAEAEAVASAYNEANPAAEDIDYTPNGYDVADLPKLARALRAGLAVQAEREARAAAAAARLEQAATARRERRERARDRADRALAAFDLPVSLIERALAAPYGADWHVMRDRCLDRGIDFENSCAELRSARRELALLSF